MEELEDVISLKKNSPPQTIFGQKEIHRTCEDILLADPSADSGTYLIDPDGQASGDISVSVYCNMTTGNRPYLKTFVWFSEYLF